MNDSGYREPATSQESHELFVKRIVESETVWALSKDNNYAYAESNKGENPADIILFWSDKAYAERTKQIYYPDFEETTITLFNFLFRWLPGMYSENVLAGTNWTGDLVGMEYNAYELRQEIEAALSSDQKERLNSQYHETFNGNE